MAGESVMLGAAVATCDRCGRTSEELTYLQKVDNMRALDREGWHVQAGGRCLCPDCVAATAERWLREARNAQED